jgi:polysaccharide biosynthesis transport protein
MVTRAAPERPLAPPPGRAREPAPAPQALPIFAMPSGGDEGGEPEESVDYRRYLEAVRKRWWLVLACVLLVGAAAAAWSLRQPRLYRASAMVSIDSMAPRVLTGVTDVMQVGSGGYWANASYYQKEYLVIQSREVARAAAAKLGLVASMPEGDAADQVVGSFELEPDKKAAGVVRLSASHTEPAQSAALANAVAEAYSERNLESRVEGNREAGTWLTLQHRDLKRKLEQSEDALYAFMEDQDVLNASLESQLAEVMQRLGTFNSRLAEVQGERIRGKLDREALREARENPALMDSLSQIQSASIVSTLKGRLNELKAKQSELAARYQEAHPKVVTLKEQLELVEVELRREIDAVMLSSERREASLEETERGMTAAIAAERLREARLNKLALDFKRLQRDVQTNERLYEMVTSRMKEADLTGAMRFNNVQILERARVPGSPYSPNRTRDLGLGLLAGLLLGLLLAVGLEVLDNTLKTQEDVERSLDVPFLGLVPFIEGGTREAKPTPESLRARDLYVLRNPKSSPAECARFIRTNLLFMGTDRPLQTLVLTSPSPQEGKTTTVVSLASTMAQAGSRTLLVDSDMRRPRLHRVFGLQNDVGLSTVIVGEATLDDAIKPSELENLDVLVCGPTPPNPSELLHTRRFLALVEELKGRYDRILFDAPPVGAVTDPVIVGAQVDGVLLVLKCQKTSRDAAKQMLRTLQDANAHVVGAILNDVDLASRRYGSAYYQYYRRYGAYYGEAKDA